MHHLHSSKDQWALATKYSHPQPAISEITHKVVSYIIQEWDHLLQFDMDQMFSPESLTRYTAALHTHGVPTRSVVGFLNCTICVTCRLSVSETLMYTGYKKCHGMKFQGVAECTQLCVAGAGSSVPFFVQGQSATKLRGEEFFNLSPDSNYTVST